MRIMLPAGMDGWLSSNEPQQIPLPSVRTPQLRPFPPEPKEYIGHIGTGGSVVVVVVGPPSVVVVVDVVVVPGPDHAQSDCARIASRLSPALSSTRGPSDDLAAKRLKGKAGVTMGEPPGQSKSGRPEL
jgi:hypothetical protein